MNSARHHTDQADSRDTLDSVEARLRAVGYRAPTIQMTAREAGERAAAIIGKLPRPADRLGRTSNQSHEGMGALVVAMLLAIGAIVGAVLTVCFLKGLS